MLAGATIALVLFTAALIFQLAHDARTLREAEALTGTVERLEAFSLALARIEAFSQTFAESGDPRQAARMTDQHRIATDAIAEVAARSADTPENQQAAVAIGQRLVRVLTLQERILAQRPGTDGAAAWATFKGESQPLLNELNAATAHLAQSLGDRRADLVASARGARQIERILGIGCAASGLVLAFAGWFIRHRIVAPPPDSKTLRKEINRLTESGAALEKSLAAANERATSLRSTLAQTSAFIWAVGRDGVYLFSEGRAEPVIGIAASEAVGRREAELLEETPTFAEFNARALRGETFTGEVSHRGRWYEVHYQPLRGPQGDIDGVVGLAVDVTERRAMEERARNEHSTREANRLHSEFLASMGHEVRTPMNGILGMSGLLQQTGLSDEQRGMLDVIENSVGDLLTAINNVLDLSKLESGKLQLAAVPIDLRQFMENTLEAHGEAARSKGLDLINDIDPNLCERVLGDESRLRQVVDNLLGNALKFTARGQVVVRVQRLASDATSLTLLKFRIEIVDSGVGLSPEAREKLLQPFEAADGAVTRKFGEAGFGLAIAKQIVDLMGGRLSISSTLGQGSAFSVEFALPYVGPSEHKPPAADLLSDSHLLLVDDNELSRGILALQLGARGATVETVDTGAAALTRCLSQSAEGKPFDVVLVDRYMPAPDGLHFIRSLRSAPRIGQTPVVLLSPDRDPGAGLAEGFVHGAVRKPFRQAAFLAAVHAARAAALAARGVAPSATAAVAETPAADAAPPPPPAPLHLLLVEDNPVNQKVATMMLKRLGHSSEVAKHGAEALEKLAVAHYDAVLMDCHMPVMDGYEATKQIRASGQAWSKIRIIAVTANSTTADRQRCAEAGFDDFVAKPITADAIQTALAAVKGRPVQPSALAAATPAEIATHA